ncbi:unnamed protein product [Meganyctiphanes norvegica]|uniref:Neuroendocrine protein 7B2 n=1 Tax=Meganyctiphanes norvegica TaxID=48144 RepID=A0AAV2SFR5_MEGNR
MLNYVMVLGCSLALASASYGPAAGGLMTDAFLREMVARMGNGLANPDHDYLEVPQDLEAEMMESALAGRGGLKELPSHRVPQMPLDYDALALTPEIRDQEYLQHSSLLGSVLANYGNLGESKQRLKPAGNPGLKVPTELKSEGVLPAYCNPPNPCPLGYTASDGCLEVFENSAGFSRDYQAMQDCMCDNEHMFECPESTRESQISALARSIQNEGVLDSTLDKIMDNLGTGNQRVIAKKFHQKKSYNPYLQGERLPIAAKKGHV